MASVDAADLELVMSRPILHVTNAASRKLHGPGRLFHIMVFPPAWLVHAGGIDVLRPAHADFTAYRENTLSLTDYRAAYERNLHYRSLGPGELAAFLGAERRWVQDGDTLVCTCARYVARTGVCHRVWAAHILQSKGWRVILDGEVLG
jgi:hypothetical protein